MYFNMLADLDHEHAVHSYESGCHSYKGRLFCILPQEAS